MKKKPRRRRASLAAILTLTLSGGAGAAPLEDAVREAAGGLAGSPSYRSIDARVGAAEASLEAAREESPWTLSSELRHGQSFPREARGMAVELETGVALAKRSGWVGALSGAVAVAEAPAASSVAVPFSVDLRLGYDVVGGGSDSAANDRARAAVLRAVGATLDAEAARLEARLAFVDQATRVFAARCKRRKVEELRKVVAATLAGAKLQLDTKTISQAEFLNFRFLDDTFAARIAAAEAEERAAVERLWVWGPALAERLRAADDVRCERGPERPPWPGDTVVETLPAQLARRADRLAAAYEARATRTDNLPAFAPFAGGRLSRAGDGDPEVTALVGLELDWNLPQARGRALEGATAAALVAATLRADETRAGAVALVRGLLAGIETELSLLSVLAQSSKSSAELASVLEVQRAIGEADALNQTTALLSAADLELGVIDGVARLASARLRLDAVLEASRAAPRHAEELSAEP